MSEGGRIDKPAAPEAAAKPGAAEPTGIPRPTGLFGASRMDGVNAQRQEIAESLNVRLAAMRKAGGQAASAKEAPAEISAKPDGAQVQRMGKDDPRLALAKKYNLNLQSPTSQQVVDNLSMTCEAFIAAFRKGSLKAEFPQEYLKMSLQQALDADKSKVRKLLIDGRFAK